MRVVILLVLVTLFSSFGKAHSQADLRLLGSASSTTFLAPPSSRTITYTVMNTSPALTAQSVVVRVANPAASYSISLDPAFAGNSNWTASTSGNFVLFTYTGNAGVIAASSNIQLQVIVNRVPPAGGAEFAVSASVTQSVSETNPYDNTWQNRFTSQ